MYKKLVSIILTLVLTLSLAACNSNKDTKATKATTKVQTEEVKSKGKVVMATTTSTDNTGLLDALKPMFRKETGWDLEWTAVGTGAALKLGQDGEADIVFVHAKDSEEEFVKNGYGVKRVEVMYNDFVIIGPKDGKIKKTTAVKQVFKQINNQKLTFVSRGDDSGTNKKELKIWKSINLKPDSNKSYISTGSGMGDTIAVAVEKNGYCLTDRGTWLTTKDKGKLDIICEKHKDLLNQYGVIAVNPEKFPKVNNKGANEFIEWITSEKTQKFINSYGKEKYGQPLFVANAKK